MAASIHGTGSGTIEEATAWHDTSGYHATRKLVVIGLTERDAVLAMLEAMAVSGIPTVGEPLDGVPGGFAAQVSSVTPRALTNTSAEITVQYDPPPDTAVQPDDNARPRLTVSSSLQPVTSNKDPATGKLLSLQHKNLKYKEQKDHLDANGVVKIDHAVGSLITQVGEVQDFVVDTTIVYERRENRDPLHKSLYYVGGLHNHRLFGAPARAWKCTRLAGTTDDGGQSYVVNYEFQRSVQDGLEKDNDGNRIQVSGWDTIVSVFDHDLNTFFANPVQLGPDGHLTTEDAEGGLEHPGICQVVDVRLNRDFRLLNLYL